MAAKPFIVLVATLAANAAIARGTSSNATLPGAWTKISPGAPTICSKGSPYAFYWRSGTTNKLVVELEGGGACWDDSTCADLGTYTTTAEPPSPGGVHDASDSRNPFKDWHHLFIPYCSADAHGGNNTHTYKGLFDKIKIHHVGRVNALTALAYAFDHGPTAPDVVATIGCSAGSLGAIINAPYVQAHFPKARHLYFGDSYVGVISTKQFSDGLHNWHLQFSDTVPGLDQANLERVAGDSSIDPGLYIVNSTITAAPTGTQFASYTSNADVVQTSFFALGGGSNWTKRMRHLTSTIHTFFPNNYNTFIAPGSRHCRTNDNGLYSVTSDKVKLGDWMRHLAVGDNLQQRRVDCESDGGSC